MGFSVSASALLVAVGLLISFGMFYTAASNGHEEISDARDEALDHNRAVLNTDLNVTGATWNGTAGELTVTVNNTGTTAQAVNDTDVVVDNELQTSFVERTVDGDPDTELWLPGEQLRVVVSLSQQPSRVKVVTEPGVADAEVV